MNSRHLILSLLLLAPALRASAAPTVDVIPNTPNAGVWEVWVTPDIATFIPNSSLEVELDIGVYHYGNLTAELNGAFWNVNGDSPGNNPFTGEVASGVVVDSDGEGNYRGTIFVAAGSELFAAAEPVLLMTFDTSLTWEITIGGRTVLPGTENEYQSARIAQNGVNYDGITFERVICVDGDFTCSGSVGNDDLTLLLDSWGETMFPPPGWRGPPPPPADIIIGNTQLTALLDHWGDINVGAGANVQLVPEPATLLLAAVLLTIPFAHRRRHP